MKGEENTAASKKVCADLVISETENELDRTGGVLYTDVEVLDYLKKKYINEY